MFAFFLIWPALLQILVRRLCRSSIENDFLRIVSVMHLFLVISVEDSQRAAAAWQSVRRSMQQATLLPRDNHWKCFGKSHKRAAYTHAPGPPEI
jgi:hypothetical protein